MEDKDINFDNYECPECGTGLTDHLNSFGIRSNCGQIVTTEDLEEV